MNNVAYAEYGDYEYGRDGVDLSRNPTYYDVPNMIDQAKSNEDYRYMLDLYDDTLFEDFYLLPIRKRIAARKILRYLINRFGNAYGLHHHLNKPYGPLAQKEFECIQTFLATQSTL